MEKISSFYKRLGFPLRNLRWSWGAHSASGVLLTTWTDDVEERVVRVSGWETAELAKCLSVNSTLRIRAATTAASECTDGDQTS
jgi:hypothetical protein